MRAANDVEGKRAPTNCLLGQQRHRGGSWSSRDLEAAHLPSSSCDLEAAAIVPALGTGAAMGRAAARCKVMEEGKILPA